MPPAIGVRHGRLVVDRVFRTERTRRGVTVVEATCDCGAKTSFDVRNIRRTRSCGCLMRERAKEANTTHGMSRTAEHVIWTSIVGRCTNASNPAFADYGGRGISIASEWREDFTAFLRDMGSRPAGATIDRIDNDGNYEPGNCRWATRRQQANNRRSNRLVTSWGVTKTLAEWALATGLPYDLIKQRLNKLGWTAERALTQPSRQAVA